MFYTTNPVYWEALRTSQMALAIKERINRDQSLREDELRRTKASMRGAWARAQWEFNNNHRLIRVFA